MKTQLISILSLLCLALPAGAQRKAATVPDDAKVETWHTVFTMHYIDNSDNEASEFVDEDMQVAFSDSRVFFNLPNPITGSTWIEGTLGSASATFQRSQLIGTFGSQPAYLDALGENGLQDVVFSYDSEARRFSTDLYVLINSSLTSSQPWCFYTDMAVYDPSSQPLPEQPLALPDGLEPKPYKLQASSILYNPDGTAAGTEPVSRIVKIACADADGKQTGLDGAKTVYVQGLCDFLPEAWIAGDVDEDDVRFAQGQYLGRMPMAAYFSGLFMNELSDVVMTVSGETLRAGSYYLCINSSKTTVAPFAVYAGATLTPFEAVAAKPQTPSIAGYQPYIAAEGYSLLRLNIPAASTDGQPLLEDNLFYRLLTDDGTSSSVYVFTHDKYINLPTDRAELIPYVFDDGYDFGYGGAQVFINDNFDILQRVGVQSVYIVGEEQTASDIGWLDIASASVSRPSATSAAAGVRLFDLQGRPATPYSRGILVKKETMADGSVRTQKIVR